MYPSDNEGSAFLVRYVGSKHFLNQLPEVGGLASAQKFVSNHF
jgi:hypothetical protein